MKFLKREHPGEGYLFTDKALWKLIVPLLIEQFLSVAVGLVDSIMVSSVGEAAVSGVSLVDQIMLLVITVFAALGGGGSVIAGRFIGRRDLNKANEAVDHLIVGISILSVIVMAVVYLIKPFILHVVFGQIDADVEANSNTYLVITAASIPFIAVYSAAAALFRVMSDSKTSMIVSVWMNVIHVIGNAVLLYGLHWGVEGVAVPTLISRIFAAIVMVILLMDTKRKIHFTRPFQRKFKLNLMKDMMYIGIPNGAENGMFQLGKVMVLSIVAVMGTSAIAANAIANIICVLAIIPGMSMSYALLAVSSQCVGAGDFNQVRFYTRKLMKWSQLIIIATECVIVACLPLFMKAYQISDQTMHMVNTIVIMHAVVSCIMWPVSFVLPSTLRASGDVIFTLAWAAVSMWVFRVVFAYVLGIHFELGVIGVWIAMFIDWLFRSVLFIVRYKRGKWQSKAGMRS